jgi:hypothetical protein
MRRCRCIIPALLTVAVIAGIAPAARAATAQDLPGVRGRLYESPTYGYTIVWDPKDWRAVAASTKNGDDAVRLKRGSSLLSLEGFTGYDGDPFSCLADIAGYLEQTTAAVGLRQQDKGGLNPFGIGYYEVWEGTVTDKSGAQTATSWYVECGYLSQTAVIRLTLSAPADLYERAVRAATPIINGVRPGPFGWTPIPPDKANDLPKSGLLDIGAGVQFHSDDDLAAAHPGRAVFTVDLTVENVDVVAAPFDLGRIVFDVQKPTFGNLVTGKVVDFADMPIVFGRIAFQVGGADAVPPESAAWIDGVADTARPDQTLKPGDVATASLLFAIPTAGGSSEATGCVDYHISDQDSFELACVPVKNGGTRSSPRLRVGH